MFSHLGNEKGSKEVSTMREIALVLVMTSIFFGGYCIMKKIDAFLAGNYNDIQNEDKVRSPSFVVLTNEMQDEEILEEIHHFCKKHEQAKILVYDVKDEEILL